MSESRRTCRFGPYTADLSRRQLLRDLAAVPLSPTAFDLLAAFLAHPGVPISREDLIARVWAGKHVEDSALSHYVSQLRNALGGRLEEYVATLPRRGYQFVAQVSWEEEPARPPVPTSPPPSAAAGRPRARTRSVAQVAAVLALALALTGSGSRAPDATLLVVMPFSDSDARPTSLGIGLSDALVRELARIPGLAVPAIGPAAYEAAAGGDPVSAASRIGARAVLVGAVGVSGDSVEVSARLLGVPGGKPFWSGSFARPASELPALQNSLAQAIAGELGLRWSAPRSTVTTSSDPQAQQAFLRGRHNQAQVTEASFERARGYYLEAIELDPRFVQARVELASLTFLEGYYGFGEGTPVERYRAAAKMLEPLLKEHPDHPLALDLLGRLQQADWNAPAAVESYRRALRAAPFDPRALQHLAWALLSMGRVAEARSEMQIAALVDTAPLRSQTALAFLVYYTGDIDGAAELFREVLAIDPSFARAHLGLGRALTDLGDLDAAERHLEIARELNGDPREPLAALGYLHAVSGRRAEARRIRNELEALETPPALLALMAAGLGEIDRGVSLIEEAIGDRSLTAFDLRDPQYSALHRHPRWRRLQDLAQGAADHRATDERIFVDEPLRIAHR